MLNDDAAVEQLEHLESELRDRADAEWVRADETKADADQQRADDTLRLWLDVRRELRATIADAATDEDTPPAVLLADAIEQELGKHAQTLADAIESAAPADMP